MMGVEREERREKSSLNQERKRIHDQLHEVSFEGGLVRPSLGLNAAR